MALDGLGNLFVLDAESQFNPELLPTEPRAPSHARFTRQEMGIRRRHDDPKIVNAATNEGSGLSDPGPGEIIWAPDSKRFRYYSGVVNDIHESSL